MRDLLASAPTLEGIRQSIRDFYCGSEKVLMWNNEGAWSVLAADTGKVAPGVRVVCVRGRYRFEMV